MGDVFDGTRRKIARHITTNVANDVLKAKTPEFLKKGEVVADDLLADPTFHAMVKKSAAKKALHYMRAYFNSQEFIDRCHATAKGMLK